MTEAGKLLLVGTRLHVQVCCAYVFIWTFCSIEYTKAIKK